MYTSQKVYNKKILVEPFLSAIKGNLFKNLVSDYWSGINLFLPAKSFTFTFAPKLINSLTCFTSPRIAAMCKGVSPRSFLLLTLSFCRDEELGVFFWVGVVCDG